MANKFVNVAPYNIQFKLFTNRQSIDRTLLLAHDVAEYPDEYRELFGRRGGNFNNFHHVIMDNSAYELKKSVDSDMVWKAVEIARPSCVVLPDVYLDGTATFRATFDALRGTQHDDSWVYRRAQQILTSPEFMAIPQGKTIAEWNRCAEKLAKLEHIDWWGIPRNYREVLGVSRKQAIEVCSALDNKKKIHLFGFSNDYVDDMVCTADRRVASIDSTTPIRAGSLNEEFHLNLLLPPRGDWWESAEWNPMIIENLQYTNKLF
jgi:hypothetical protein